MPRFATRIGLAVLFVSLISASNTTLPHALAQDASADRAALIALYHATDGPNWKNKYNWLSDAPISEWHGVTTNSDGRVVELFLFDNGLSGEIPPELGNLTDLTALTLISNWLSGEIPLELSRLTKLTWLSLDGNQLSGEIPRELAKLTHLESLGLSENRLSGEIPRELGSLSNLELLFLNNNRLSESIPSELEELTNLTVLWLSDNRLSGEIPPEFGNFSKLTVLNIAGNQLTGCIPRSLQNVQHNDISDLSLPFCGTEVPSITPTPAPTPTPAIERGFFFNSNPSQRVPETERSFNLLDPVTLSLIGIVLTLIATSIQLFKGK